MTRTGSPTPHHPSVADALAGRIPVADWARSAARSHSVAFTPTPADTFAAAVSRLADAEAAPDAVEHLLLALRRAGVVTAPERLQLHAAYLRQAD